jgi:prepilin-type N-terminal cleavage/methylation domain-containing protein
MTHTSHDTPRRSGFTLIELLVVLAIIAVLLALSSAAVMKARTSQAFNRTSESVTKLQKALSVEVDRINSKTRSTNTTPAMVLAYCDNDPQRAMSVFTAIEQRKNFPQTFAEATSPAYIVQTSTGALGLRLGTYNAAAGEAPVYTHNPLQHFVMDVGPLVASGPYPANQESAVLLYIILSKQSASGAGAMAVASDDLTDAQQVNVALGGVTKKAFADGFKNPIGFNRWDTGSGTLYASEVQSAPFVDPKTVTAGGSTDPLDPRSLCVGWSNPTKQAEVQSLLAFTGKNRVFNVYSLGLDGVASKDDVLGFRTLQPGNKGFAP